MTEAVEVREFDILLDYLQRTRGFEFNAYKRPSLMRRIRRRLQMVSVDGFDHYTDFLEVHPEEFGHLFNSILINVTAFFRDESAWDYVRDSIVSSLVGAPADTQPVRVWSAGCASGEESYSIAMLLADALGPEAFRDRVKIYATDVDNDALNQARAASYTAKQVECVPAPLRDRYFTRDGDRFVVDKDLRRVVIFGRHDLIQDAPISRVNLLICRNTLMYFNAEAQSRIFARFHFALADTGILFLGKAEMLPIQGQLFAPVDVRRRVFRKVRKDDWRERLAIMTKAGAEESYGPVTNHTQLYPAAFEASPHAQFVVDAGGALMLFNDRAAALFTLTASDVGRALQDLELSYRPLELRSPIEQAIAQRRALALKDVEWRGNGPVPRFFDVSIVPLIDGGGKSIGVGVSFTDVTRAQELQFQLNRAKQELETAYEELQSTNEELETTNEELQSTVEELETTNEELQSTNEELETMNEELQSTNEELQALNEELRNRTEKLNRTNSLLESILTGVRSGVVVLDRELHVIAWNRSAEELWGLRADEAQGQNFLNLDIGLPTNELRADIRASLAGDGDFRDTVVVATNRRGRPINCRVTSTPLHGSEKEIRGVILLMDEQPPRPN